MNVFYSEDISSDLRGIIVAKDNYRTGHSSPWDDFDYKVKFKIYFKDENTEILLGHIRILKNHQKNTANFFKEKGTKIDNKNYEITDLFNDKEIISLPLNLSFYKKLKSIFNSEEENIIDFLTSIRDGSTFINEENIFSKFSGYNDTLLREGSTSEAILKKGYQVALGRYADIKTISLDININHEKFDTFNLNFDKNRKYGERNINLLIGRNGSGKTYILNNIINSILNINNSKISYPYFNKIIIAAFSPFEKFLTQNDISNIYINEIKNKKLKTKFKFNRLPINKYSYIGFRNTEGEFDIKYPIKKSSDSVLNILEYDSRNYWWDSLPKTKLLRDTLSLSIDFDDILIKKDNDYISIENISVSDRKNIKTGEGIFFSKNNKIIQLSSGQQIYSYLIPTLIDEIEEETLVIIDEPELYLHPGLELGLIKMLKHLLKDLNSFAIIATHSSIITREVDREAVNVLRRTNDFTSITKPSIQTYGADLESIISEVFEDDLERKVYEDSLDQIIPDDEDEIDFIEVNSEVGNSGLIYLLNKSSDEDFQVEN